MHRFLGSAEGTRGHRTCVTLHLSEYLDQVHDADLQGEDGPLQAQTWRALELFLDDKADEAPASPTLGPGTEPHLQERLSLRGFQAAVEWHCRYLPSLVCVQQSAQAGCMV